MTPDEEEHWRNAKLNEEFADYDNETVGYFLRWHDKSKRLAWVNTNLVLDKRNMKPKVKKQR